MGNKSSKRDGGPVLMYSEPAIRACTRRDAASLDGILVPLVVISPELRIIAFNTAFREVFASICGREPALGEPVSVIPFRAENSIKEDESESITALCQRAFTGKDFYVAGHCAGLHENRSVLLNFTPISDVFRQPLMLTITLQDFPSDHAVNACASGNSNSISPHETDPGALEIRADDLQATFDLAAVGIAHVAPDGKWLRVNQRICDMLGYTREELLSTNFQDITHPADLEADNALLQQVLNGRRASYVLEKRYLHKNGSAIWAYLAVSLLRDGAGRPRYFISVISDINVQKKALAEAEESRARMKAVFDSLSEAVFVFNAKGRIVEANSAALRLFGYADIEEARASGSETTRLFEARTLDSQVLAFNKWPISRILRGESISNVELEIRRRDSDRRWIGSFSGSRTLDNRKIPQLAVLTIRNITKQHYAETALRVSEQRFRTAFDNIPDMVAIYDQDFRIRYVNLAMSEAAHRPASALIGRRDDEIAAPGLVTLWRPLLHIARTTKSVQTNDIQFPSPLGTRYVTATCVPLLNATGQVEEVMCIFHDYTERKRAEDKARQAALHDPLTNLPNRALLFEYARHVLGGARRMHENVAVMFIDLDRFKPINDLHGHEAGDEILRQVAQRFEHSVREEDMVFRLGGDEFLVLLPRIKNISAAGELALQILNTLSQPYHVAHLELTLSASIGISLYPVDGNEIDALINHADAAMYYAKQHGRNSYQFYLPEMSEIAEAQFVIEHELKRAISQKEFCLFYQPVVDIHTGELVCLEALIRWPANRAGPDRFVPIAEATGLIGPVGEWVLSEACRQYQQWSKDGLPAIPIAVNVSSVQFKRKGLADYVDQVLRRHGLDACAIQIELTETAVMDDIDYAINVLSRFKEIGIKIALDDFGTGYSSLNYLSRLPLDKLKIDQSFVHRIDSDTAGRAITEAIIVLGRTLGLEIVAEGVESERALTYLREHGCHQAQGYFICKPLSSNDLIRWVQTRSVHRLC
jgi:diguanylate cyclase (GGDEF)-like protein/PAS domain S-box-containing protein